MQKTKHWLMTIAALLCSLTVSAHDFEVGGIYYRITSIMPTFERVEVTFKGDGPNPSSNGYSGTIRIPSTVSYDDVVYSVTSIGEYAFAWCTTLTSVIIPEGVTSIGDNAFDDCHRLTSITIPESVTSIGASAFAHCGSLTSINVPESVTSIGDYAFRYCSSLTAINIPEGVTSIGAYVFSDCSSLVSITLPHRVTSIGEQAFYNCSSLASITIPEGVTSIAYDAFEGTAWYNNQPSGVIYAGKVLYRYKGTMLESTSIEVIEGTVSINPYAFEDCSSLTSITLPQSITSIGEQAFYKCSSLTSITIPEGVTRIEGGTFSFCSSLASIILPAGVTSIGSAAFGHCGSLTDITIPESVTSIEGYAFNNCTGLTTITLPEGVTSIGASAFAHCGSLTDITIPESVTSIEFGAFSDCGNLNSITIPEGVTNIGNFAFQDCSQLSNVCCYAKSVPTAYDKTFAGICESAILYVPASVIEDYRITAPWSDFDIIETIEVEVTNITLSQSSALLKEGESMALNAIVTPDNATDGTISWTSSNPSVATVDADGKVIAVVAGSTTITATANDGSGVSASCEVIVEKRLVSAITLSQTTATLIEGESLTLDAVVTPDNAADKTVSWISSNPAVATVDANGMVTAVAEGTAIIAANANDGSGVSALCEVTVKRRLVSAIILCQTTATLLEGESLTLDAVVTPDNATDKTVSWTSSNPAVATVDADGTVNAVVKGTAIITATANDGSGVSASCEVTVKEKPYDVIFMVDGEVYHICSSEDVTFPEAPEKQNHTFVEWLEGDDVVLEEVDLKNNADAMLYSNAYCTDQRWGDQFVGWHVLFDGEPNTFFHSEYSNVDSEDGLDHYIRVDMGKGVEKIAFTYTVRGNIPNYGNYSPKKMIVEGSNTENGEYTEIAALTELPRESGAVYESPILGNGNKYRYIRFRVTETYQNQKVHGHPYFFMAEFGLKSSKKTRVYHAVYNLHSITININQYGSATYCSEYALDFSEVEGLKAYAATGYKTSTGIVTLTRVMTSQPGMGLFLKGEPGDEYAVPILESTDENSLNMLVGTLESTPVNGTSDDGQYYNYRYTIHDGDAEPMFYRVDDGYTLGAGKAYLQIPVAWMPAEAKAIAMRFDDGGTTDIEDIESGIQHSELIYDLMGRKVTHPQKGVVYIVNGKKVVIK